MTDFVHEGPKDPNKPPVPGEEKPTTERERMKKVYTYVAVLFRSGNNTLQSTLDENQALTDRITELEEQLAAAEENAKALDETAGLQSNQLRALDWLLEIEQAYGAKDYDTARENIRSFEETGVSDYLPTEPLRTAITGDDAPSPAARYQAIADELFPNGVN